MSEKIRVAGRRRLNYVDRKTEEDVARRTWKKKDTKKTEVQKEEAQERTC